MKLKREKKKRSHSIDSNDSHNPIKKNKKKLCKNDINIKLPFKSYTYPLLPFQKIFWYGLLPENPISETLKLKRKSMNILVKGNVHLCPPPIECITDSCLPDSFKFILSRFHIKELTPIQKQSWSAILYGCNVIGVAPTGSGKTLAYCLPMIPHIQDRLKSLKSVSVAAPLCLVVVPTRELALQVSSCLKHLRAFNIKALPIYGGQDRDKQTELLRDTPSVHVIAATPGRLIDLMGTRELSLDRVTYLVIDEADRMLALGFEEQLNTIGSCIRPDRQTLLFTATFPGKLRESSSRWAGDPESTVIIRVNTMEIGGAMPAPTQDKTEPSSIGDECAATEETPTQNLTMGDDETAATDGDAPMRSSSLTVSKSIVQHVHVCAAHKKPRLLINYIKRVRDAEKAEKVRQPGPMIIFCTKIKTLHFVVNFLNKNGVTSVQQLHGQLPQQRRESVLSDFKAGKVLTLCATDVAARGIHVKRLKYVVNYDFPGSLEQYCHRVGRTGRKEGEQGHAYSLLTRNMAPLAEDLVALLRNCEQEVEPNLLLLVSDFKNGLIDMTAESDEGDGEK